MQTSRKRRGSPLETLASSRDRRAHQKRTASESKPSARTRQGAAHSIVKLSSTALKQLEKDNKRSIARTVKKPETSVPSILLRPRDMHNTRSAIQEERGDYPTEDESTKTTPIKDSEGSHMVWMDQDLLELCIFRPDSSDSRRPDNFNDISSAIQREREDNPNLEDYVLYHRYHQRLYQGDSHRGTREELFNLLLFGTVYGQGVLAIKPGHSSKYSSEWLSYQPIMDYFNSPKRLYGQRPEPNYAEGIDPRTIGETNPELHPFMAFNEFTTLPNFLVEYKQESTIHARTWNRWNGAIAVRAWRDFRKRVCSLSDSDNAYVGSMEFNGDAITAHLHWATRRDDNQIEETVCYRQFEGTEYRMVRVMDIFADSLNYEEFVRSRKMVRNFCQYFSDQRDQAIQAFRKAQSFNRKRVAV